jgi:hypothetical protein
MIRVYATGISCDETINPRPAIYFGHLSQRVESLTASSVSGVCEVRAVVPGGILGSAVEVTLEVMRQDGYPVKSNAIQIAIEP